MKYFRELCNSPHSFSNFRYSLNQCILKIKYHRKLKFIIDEWKTPGTNKITYLDREDRSFEGLKFNVAALQFEGVQKEILQKNKQSPN